MPQQPSRTQVHVDGPLTNFAVAYMGEQGYVFERMPRLRVAKQSDKYFEYNKEYWMRTDVAIRANGAESAGSGFKASTNPYFCDKYAIHMDVDDDTIANADSPIAYDRDAARWVAHQMALDAEIVFAGAVFGASAWGSSGAPSTTWDNVASTPIEDVRAQYNAIVEKTQQQPNTLILGAEVFKRLVDHPDILDRIKYTQRGVVTEELLAALFGVEQVLVHWAARTNTAEQATASYDFLGNSGKNALLVYLNRSPGLFTPSGLTVFEWRPLTMKRMRIDLRESDRIEANRAFDIKVTGSDLGYEFTSAVAS